MRVEGAPRANALRRRTSCPPSARMQPIRRFRTMDGRREGGRTFARPLPWRRGRRPAISFSARAEEGRSSSGEKGFGETLVGVDAFSQLFDIDVLVRCVSDVNGARPEEERLPPVREQRNVRGVGDRSHFETRYRREALRRNVRAEFHVRVAFLGPVDNHLLYRPDVADEPEHDLGFGVRGDDIRLGSAFDRSDVDGRLTEHRIRLKRQLAKRRQQLEHRLDRRTAEVRICRVRLTATGPDGGAQRSLGTARELALGRLTVDQKATARTEIVGSARAIGALLLSHDEEDVDALLTACDEPVCRYYHGGRDSFRVRRAAPKQPRALESRRDVWRDGVKGCGDGDAVTPSRKRNTHI